MNCPKCGGPLQPGRAVVEWPPIRPGSLWYRTALVGSGPLHWYFEPRGGEERVPLVGRPDLTAAYRCPGCETVVITPDDPTREEMVARWQRLTAESPRK